jgi:microcystin-dependent protein
MMGTANVALMSQQMPMHQHAIFAATPGATEERTAGPATSGTSYLSDAKGSYIYQNPGTTNTPFAPNAIGMTGGSQPHDNMQPYLVLNFCISLYGVFPPRN